MPEAPVPGQAVGQPNPDQPAGYNPPATPAPQDHPPVSPGNVDSSGGWMPNGPIPAVAYTPTYQPPGAPPGVDGYTAPGTGYVAPMQGAGVVIQPSQQAPPNTQPGLSGGGGAYGSPPVIPSGREAQVNQYTTGLQAPAGTAPDIAGPVGVPGTGVNFAGVIPTTAMPAGPTMDLWLEGYADPPVQAPPNVTPGYQLPASSYPGGQYPPASVPLPYLTLRPIRISIAAGQANTLLIGGAGRVVYVTARESTGTQSASFSLYDGTQAGGGLMMPVSLTAGQSFRDNLYPHGMPFTGDLWFTADSGSLTGAVYVIPEDVFTLAERQAELLAKAQAVQGWQN